jgi:hypothetical protein
MHQALLAGLLLGVVCPVVGSYLIVPQMAMLGDDAIRLNHYSYRTKTDVQGIRRYILFHHKGHPQEMGVPEAAAAINCWIRS